jgi:hypothetical protein
MMVRRIKVSGRYVAPITSLDGRKNYYQVATKIEQGLTGECLAVPKVAAILPICNGDRWALFVPGERPILATGFDYSSIIPERWGANLFFVQDANSKKWGVLSIDNNRRNVSPDTAFIKTSILMPPIADDIYEDQMLSDCSSTTFWMTRCGDKVGILTPHGYTDIIYNTYEDNPADYSFRLIRRDGDSKLIQYSSPNKIIDCL